MSLIVFSLGITILAFFKIYSGSLVRWALVETLNIKHMRYIVNSNALKILRIALVNFGADFLLIPKSYDFKLATTYIVGDRMISLIELILI